MLQMIKNRPVFCVPFIPSVIDSIAAGGPADKLGVKAGDRVVAVNGKAVRTLERLR